MRAGVSGVVWGFLRRAVVDMRKEMRRRETMTVDAFVLIGFNCQQAFSKVVRKFHCFALIHSNNISHSFRKNKNVKRP